MRKFMYGISLFFFEGILFWGYYVSYEHKKSDSDIITDHTVEAESVIYPEYHIDIHEGKVIVYLKDGSVYETTDITWEHLPQEMQSKIEDGYILYSAQELYNFLEAYSS